ncbi:MAG: hypothetical protein N2663_09350 [Chlorobi bacterium]|nr:hypothetical protein [Chlorobiota bacterium]
MMRVVAMAFGVVVFSVAAIGADENTAGSSIRVGTSAMGGVTLHVVDFTSLPDLATCCPRFRDGSGLGAAAVVWGEYPFAGSVVAGLRAGLSWFGGTLRSLERKPILVDDTPREAVIQHSLGSTFRAMRWDGYLGVRTSDVLDVFVGVGTELIQRAEVNVQEELVQPERGTFENGQRVRNQQRAWLSSSTRAMLSGIAGMRFSIPLDAVRRWLLVPELNFRYGLDPVVQSNQWYIYSVSVGVGVAFEPIPYRHQLQQPTVPEQESQQLLPLDASIVAYGVGADGEQIPLRLVPIERRRWVPLYPTIYTDGVRIAERYVLPLSSDDRSWKTTLSSLLGGYYAILPIVAERLRTSDAILEINGYDAQSVAIARQRAEYVARYFQAIFGVPPNRLRIRGQVDERDTVGRVVLDGPAMLFAPIEYRDTVRQILPAMLRLRPATNGVQLLRRWSLRLRQGELVLAVREGEGGLPLRIDIPLKSELLRGGLPLHAEVSVEGIDGDRASAQVAITLDTVPLEQQISSIVEYFFFANTRLTAATLEQLVAPFREHIEDITIVVYGHSLESDDAVEHYRRTLSEAGLPTPRLVQEEPLYRPITPERILYGHLLSVRMHLSSR